MSSIGPQIPAHLLQQLQSPEDDESEEDEGPQPSVPTGPSIPTTTTIHDEDEDEDDGPQPASHPSVGPMMPQGSGRSAEDKEEADDVDASSTSHRSPPKHGTSEKKRVLGPSFPSYAPTYSGNINVNNDDDDDDDDVGPMPLPAGMQYEQPDAIKAFLEKEEKRRKAAKDALKPKAPKRDEWMLVPPTSSGLLGNLDPTKLKGRQFSRSAATATNNNDMSLWTETPAERQQRLADEVSGKKRRVTEAPVEDEDEVSRKRRRKQEEDAIRKGVDTHTRTKRGAALVEQHADTIGKKPTDNEPPVIWDHSRDMAVGGKLMDDSKRNKMLNEAKSLGDRFGSGRSGGFL